MEATYDAIASHFSATRYKPWPHVHAFLQRQPRHAIVFDDGCGNGKYAASVHGAGSVWCGIDLSSRLLAHAPDTGTRVHADGLRVPYRDGIFDVGISIAVVHHLSTEAQRRRYVAELVRVLRPGAAFLVCAWATTQDNPRCAKKATLLPDQPERGQDVHMPWQDRDTSAVTQRFYHLFDRKELKTLFADLDVRIDASYFEKENWVVEGVVL